LSTLTLFEYLIKHNYDILVLFSHGFYESLSVLKRKLRDNG